MPTDYDFESCAFEIVKEVGQWEAWNEEDARTVIYKYLEQFHIRIPSEETVHEHWMLQILGSLYVRLTPESIISDAKALEPILRDMDAEAVEEVKTGILASGWEAVDRGMAWLLRQLQLIVDTAFGLVTTGLDGILDKLKYWFDPETGIIRLLINAGFDSLRSIFNLEDGFIGKKIAGTLDGVITIGTTIKSLVASMLDFPARFATAVTALAGKIYTQLDLVVSRIVDIGEQVISDTIDWLITKMTNIVTAVKTALGWLINQARIALAALITIVTGYIKEKIGETWTWYVNILADLKTYVLQIAEDIFVDIVTIFTVVGDELSVISTAMHTEVIELVAGFSDVFDDFKTWADEMLSIDTEKLPASFAAIKTAMDKYKEEAVT